MAIVAAGLNYELDYWLRFLWNGPVTSNSGSKLIVTYGPDFHLTFYGSNLAWKNGYGLSGGTFTGYEIHRDGQLKISISKVSIDGNKFFSKIYTPSETALSYLLAANDRITGSKRADHIKGFAGNDTLDGGRGADDMHGGYGNDLYIVDHSRDLVNELEKEGRDTVLAKRSYALDENSIELLSAFDLKSTKKIDLTGNTFGQTLKGNAGSNILKGLSGSDKLLGYSGRDILIGGDGEDFLTGGKGRDVFVFDMKPGLGIDRILDFSVKDDTIKLVSSVFSGLTPGVLPASAFVRASSATDSDDRIIYDPATGALSFDPDGSGVGAALIFAKTAAQLRLSNTDFYVV